MIRNSTKLTAILVAAASVISSIPAAAAVKLGTKDGTIEKGVAFKDGRYLYQGYRSDDDDTGLYYNNGNRDKQLDDADEIDQKFDDKYVSALDGDDYYVVDMTTGKITDDDTIDDLQSTAGTKLANKLDGTKRYDKQKIDFQDKSKNPGASATIERVSNNRFEDVWYAYNVTTGGQIDKFGYTTESGKYIDCSFDLNLYAYYNPTTGSAASGKMHKIEDVEDNADIQNEAGTKLDMSVQSLKFIKYIGQDDKYIYSIIKVGVKNGMSIGAPQTAENGIRYSYYVQKVSKQQGSKEEGAYKPKDTDCFEITPDYKNSDAKDAYETLMKLVDGSTFADDTAKASVVNNAIYITYNDGDDKVKTDKILLKSSQKLDNYYYGSDGWHKDRKVDGRIAIKDSDVDHDIEDKESWAIDVNGTVWAIDGGKIMKSVKGGDFETVYTCDRSLNRLDVYDEDNLIAWDDGGEAYTTVQEGSDESKKEAEEIVGSVQPVKTGWQKESGSWYLYDVSGAQLTGWQFVGGKWYYMDPVSKAMETGWIKSPASGKWYYMDASGAMTTGWQFVGGKWYYMNPNNGDMQTGWIYTGGCWYYLDPFNGDMKTGWVYDGAHWYYMYQNGAMAYNTTINGYRLNSSGAWIN